MDIASVAMSMTHASSLSKIGTAMLDKALETNDALGQGLIKMVDAAAMERSVNPHIGSNFDMLVQFLFETKTRVLPNNGNTLCFTFYNTNNINYTNAALSNAENEEIKFALGETENTHDLTIALQKASTALQYTVAVRDKLLEAYKEIMNMQI